MVVIETVRAGYSPEQVVDKTMTVGELVEYLQINYYSDEPIVLSFDNGYTFGHLNKGMIDEI